MRFGCTAVARGLLLAWGGPGSTVAHGQGAGSVIANCIADHTPPLTSKNYKKPSY